MVMRAIMRRLKRRARLDGSKVRGVLDGVDRHGLHGWATDPSGAVRVEVRSGARVVAAAVATLPRPDVSAAGAGPLNCGFCFSMERLAEGALKAGASPHNAPLRLLANGVELRSVLPSLDADGLVEAQALAWFQRETLG